MDVTHGRDVTDADDLVYREKELLKLQRHEAGLRERLRYRVIAKARRFKADPLLRDRTVVELLPVLAVHFDAADLQVVNAYFVDIWPRIDDRVGCLHEVWAAASGRPLPPAAADCPDPLGVNVLKFMAELAERSRRMDLKAVQKLAKRNALYPAMPEDGVYHARPVELGDFVFGQTPVSEVLGADQRDVSRWVRHWMAEKTVERMAERGPGRAAVYRFIGATA